MVTETDSDRTIDAMIGADMAMLYYAGHSIQIDGENYLIPKDASFAKDTDLDTYLIDTARIRAVMDDASAVKITILDVCRDNPFLDDAMKIHDTDGNTRSITRGLAPIAPPEDIEEQTESGAYCYASSSSRDRSIQCIRASFRKSKSWTSLHRCWPV